MENLIEFGQVVETSPRVFEGTGDVPAPVFNVLERNFEHTKKMRFPDWEGTCTFDEPKKVQRTSIRRKDGKDTDYEDVWEQWVLYASGEIDEFPYWDEYEEYQYEMYQFAWRAAVPAEFVLP